jgi:nucleoside-diphosphate-sugar epimerase
VSGATGAGAARGRAAPTLFVTGATGLVGSHAATLFRERGWNVRAFVRPESDLRFLEELDCEFVLGDLRRPETLRGAARGCDAVLHAAALVAAPAGWEAYRRVNVEGTRLVLQECLRAGSPRFLHVSSVAVYGPPGAHPALPLDEDAAVDLPLEPRAHYERSKRMAESVVRRATETDWTILRPAVVMGERDRNFTPRIATLAGRRLLPTVGPGDNPLPVVYAGNVAEACWLALTRPEACRRIYNVADDGALTQRELLSEAAPDGTLLVPLPRRALEACVAALERMAPAGPDRPAPLLSPRRVWFAGRPNPFRSARIREELGWRPALPALEGWRRALAWHRRVAPPRA